MRSCLMAPGLCTIAETVSAMETHHAPAPLSLPYARYLAGLLPAGKCYRAMAASESLRRRCPSYHVMLTDMMAGGFRCHKQDHTVPSVRHYHGPSKENQNHRSLLVLASLCGKSRDTDLIGVFITKHASRLSGAWYCRKRGRMGAHISARAP